MAIKNIKLHGFYVQKKNYLPEEKFRPRKFLEVSGSFRKFPLPKLPSQFPALL